MTAGRVTVDGVDVRDLRLSTLRRDVGVVLQDPFLFSATVGENIAFARPNATQQEIERAARLAQAEEFTRELPDGYDTVIGERGITLSGGQRQQIAIARALILEPRILILDDATASVDATTEARIRSGLREAMEGRTTIIIAHRLSTLALADELVVLDRGRIAARGTHDQLLGTSLVYREIYEHGLLEREFAERVEGEPDERRGTTASRAAAKAAAFRALRAARALCGLAAIAHGLRHEGLAGGESPDDAARRRGARLVVARDGTPDPFPRAVHEALPAADDARGRPLLLATLTALVPPYLAKLAIDDGVRGGYRAAHGCSSLMIAAGLASLLTSSAQTYFTGWTASGSSPTSGTTSSDTCSGFRSGSTNGTVQAS